MGGCRLITRAEWEEVLVGFCCEENAETFTRSGNVQTKRENVDMMALTETPYAEDFSMELFELIQHYRQRGLSDGWILAILKDAVEDREDDDD